MTQFTPAPFDGRRFGNPSGRPSRHLSTVLRWMWNRKRVPWPESIGNPPAPRPLARVTDGSILATPIGHATVLIQVAGLNLLTDPMWSDCAGPFSWLGVKRVRPPAIALDDIPQIDAILLSHDHYDHLDRPTLAALARRDAPPVITGLKVGKAVPSADITELDWWQSHALGNGITATYVPAEHSSGRGPFNRESTLWGGFVLDTPAGTIYFAGDTGDGAHFAAIRERFGPMKLAIIPIGAYEPRWFMAPVHLDPAQAVAASLTLEAETSLAIHFGTFPLADDPIDAAPRELAEAIAAAREAGRPVDFRLPEFGQPIIV